MAQPYNPDPLEEMIADGRVHIRPIHHYGLADVITIDLEFLAASLKCKLERVFLNDNRIRKRYLGNFSDSTKAIIDDTTNLVDYLAGQTYNYLRLVLEVKAPNVRVKRMNKRCPIPKKMEFPAWISATLSCIGPFRIMEGPRDRLIVYASTTETMDNYGRKKAIVFNEGGYSRIMSALREIGVFMAPFTAAEVQGAPTPAAASPTPPAGAPTTSAGAPTPAIDAPPPAGGTPFESVGMTIGYVNDKKILKAIVEGPTPPHPDGQTVNSVGRPVGHEFRVNYWGIQAQAQPKGIYVIGRGLDPYYQCILAHDISETEIMALLRQRILRTT